MVAFPASANEGHHHHNQQHEQQPQSGAMAPMGKEVVLGFEGYDKEKMGLDLPSADSQLQPEPAIVKKIAGKLPSVDPGTRVRS